MEGRIILNNADFSANNIGRYVKLNALTEKVLSRQTQYANGSEESIALDTFIEALIGKGYLGGASPKIKTLYIPALASSHAELFYDIARLDSNGFPTDGMSDAEKSAANKCFELLTSGNRNIGYLCTASPNGVPLSEADFTLQSKVKQAMFAGLTSYPAFSCIYYNSQADYSYSEKAIMIGNTVSPAGTSPAGFQVATTVVELKKGVDNLNRIYLNNSSVYGNGFIGISFQPTGVRLKVMGDSGSPSQAYSTAGNISDVITTDMQENFFAGRFSYSTNSKGSLIMFADYMSEEEMGELRTLIQTLMVALGVRNA